MRGLLKEIRQALRSLRRSPAFTATALATIAIAIGSNAAIFSIVDAVVLSPLPYRSPNELVAVWEVLEGQGEAARVAARSFVAWRDRANRKTIQGISAFGGARLTLTGAGDPVQLAGSRVDDAYFDLLGVAPRLGRAFRREDTIRGAPPVVLISEGLWRERFSSDPAILGRAVVLEGTPRTVVGVMPRRFLPAVATTTATISFASDTSFWIPVPVGSSPPNPRSYVLGVLARLAPGTERARAESEIAAIQRQMHREDGANRAAGARVRMLVDEAEGTVRPRLLLLGTAVLFVFLIACVNVANLLFARSETRRRELAIRAALGGSRARILRQLAVESLLLAGGGALAGIALAGWSLPFLIRLVPQGVPRLSDVSLSGSTIGYALLLSIGAGVLFGVAPALHTTRGAIEEDLRSTSRSASGSRRTRRALSFLVLAEIAVASLLVVAAGLVTRSFGRLSGVDVGFRPSPVLVVPVDVPQKIYDRPEKVAAFQDALLARLKAEPGIASAALAYNHPLEAHWIGVPKVVGSRNPAPETERFAWFRSVSEGYFSTVGVALRQGRDFTPADDARHPGVAIVNEAFARREFPGESPVGKRLVANEGSFWWGADAGLPGDFEIVGVTADVRFLGPAKDPEPAYYLPARQFPIPDMKVIIRTGGEPLALLPAVARHVRALDPSQPLGAPATIAAITDESIAQPRFAMRLMLAFGAAGLALAALGIYGLLSFVVTLRTREIGVRMALGARAGQVVRLVVSEVAPLAAGGAVLGVAAALAAGPLLRGLLFGISPWDPVSILAAPAALAAIALAAASLPARRAARVDPMVSLRNA
ncbi:MAG: ABC transporter permease [Acidobacteriota bacterium]|nr:ABC transporter permease [Acidobacteriota bacterium]